MTNPKYSELKVSNSTSAMLVVVSDMGSVPLPSMKMALLETQVNSHCRFM